MTASTIRTTSGATAHCAAEGGLRRGLATLARSLARRSPARSRPVAAAVAFCVAALAGVSAAHAEGAYPVKPIEIVVPYSAGGSSDFSARQVATRLQKRLGQPVVVVNRPGASGEIGVTTVARANPDGYTLLLALNTELLILPQIRPTVHYSLDQFEPISLVGSTPLVLIGRKGLKARTFDALIQELRTVPGHYDFGGATGSPAHISGEWLKQAAKLPLQHVPYKGGAQSVIDVAGGHLDLYFSGIAPALSLIKSGTVIAYATTSPSRSAILPDVPTMEEAGLKNFEVSNWTALLAPKGTPPEVVALLKKQMAEILADPKLHAAMEKQGIEPPPSEPPQTYLLQEQKKYHDLITSLGIRPQ